MHAGSSTETESLGIEDMLLKDDRFDDAVLI
jgi:hypothetical protein